MIREESWQSNAVQFTCKSLLLGGLKAHWLRLGLKLTFLRGVVGALRGAFSRDSEG